MSDNTSEDQTTAMPLEIGANLVGQRFGHYQILSELGRGGMATVYKADEESLNRVVALKIMSPKISSDPTMVKRFQREAQAAAALNHPGIVHIYAIGEEHGIHYFTMEYVKGQSLAQLKKARNRIPPGEAANYILQTAEALGEAHRNGMVHRDIKPANIMLDPAGRVRVTDFGIARVASANTQLTVDGSFLGTPQYMSPEQCEGKELDGRSDLYSLGLTFYELVSGRKPFDAETPGSIIVKIVNGDMISIQTAAPDLPGPVCAVIDKLLQRDPAQRYQSAEELAADLRPLVAAAATQPDTPTRAFVAPAQARPPTAAAKPPAMPTSKPAAPPQNSESHVLLVIAAVIIVLALLGAGACYGVYTLWQRAAAKERYETAAAEVARAAAQAEAGAVADVDVDALPTDDAEPMPTVAIESASVMPDLRAEIQPSVAVEPTALPDEQPDLPAVETPQPLAEADAPSAPAPDAAVTPAPASAPEVPAVSQVAMVVPAAPPAPAEGSLMMSITGDNTHAGLLVAAAQTGLRGSSYKVIEPMSPTYDVSTAAEYMLVIDVSPLGSRALQYMGRVTEQRSETLTLKIIRTADGQLAAGPVSRTVEYTVFNADAKLRDAMGALIDNLRYPDPP